MAPVLTAEIFRSPMIDYRIVAVGALLPIVDVVIGSASVTHTLLFPVGLLTVVMLATQKQRLVRRRWLGLPIGAFFHLVLDGTWTGARPFWWPATGFGFEGLLAPETTRPSSLILFLEAVSIAVGWWAWRRYELERQVNRRRLIKSGQLSREVIS